MYNVIPMNGFSRDSVLVCWWGVFCIFTQGQLYVNHIPEFNYSNEISPIAWFS